MYPIFKTQELIESFKENGYVKLDLLTDSQLKYIKEEVAALSPDDNFNPKAKGSIQNDYHCTYLDTNLEYKRRVKELITELFTPVINSVLEGYYVLNGNFYVKPPGKGDFVVHQNWHHLVDQKITSVTAWFPLDDVTRENGTLEVIPKSHKIIDDIATATVPYYFDSILDQLKKKYLEPIEMKAGECLIFDDSIIHYSRVNQSPTPRYAIQIELFPVSETPVFYYYNKEKTGSDFEIFEIDETFFLEANINNMFDRPKNARLTGRVPNLNKLISEQEFLELMQKGEAKRAKIYASPN